MMWRILVELRIYGSRPFTFFILGHPLFYGGFRERC